MVVPPKRPTLHAARVRARGAKPRPAWSAVEGLSLAALAVTLLCGAACGPEASTHATSGSEGGSTRGEVTSVEGSASVTTGPATEGDRDDGTGMAAECSDSPFPAPYCYREYDVTGGLGSAPLDFAVGGGRFGPAELGGFLLVAETRKGGREMRHLAWDVRTSAASISGLVLPDDLALPAQQELYVVARVEPGPFDGLVGWADLGEVLRFRGTSRGVQFLSSDTAISELPNGGELAIGAVHADLDLDSDGVDEVLSSGHVWRRGRDGWEHVVHLPHDAAQPRGAGLVCSYSDRMKSADVDADGREDIVILPAAATDCPTGPPEVDRVVAVVRNTTGTTRGLQASYLTLPFEDGDRDLLVGDFDGDTHIDIVVRRSARRTQRQAPALAIMLGSGRGAFEPAAQLLVEDVANLKPIRAHAVDLDGDGRDELVVLTDEKERRLVLIEGLRSGGVVTDLGASPIEFAAFADVNGDGRADILARTSEGWSLLVSSDA